MVVRLGARSVDEAIVGSGLDKRGEICVGSHGSSLGLLLGSNSFVVGLGGSVEDSLSAGSSSLGADLFFLGHLGLNGRLSVGGFGSGSVLRGSINEALVLGLKVGLSVLVSLDNSSLFAGSGSSITACAANTYKAADASAAVCNHFLS